jgi:hypothetical protein
VGDLRLLRTLIDWNGGIRGRLARVFGEERADELLGATTSSSRARGATARSYRKVMTEAMRRSARRGEERRARHARCRLAAVLRGAAGAEEARGRGWKLAILSNTDRDYIEASMRRSAFRSSSRSSRRRSARTSLRSALARLRGAGRPPVRRPRRRRASFTTSPRRTTWRCRRSGSTGSARPRSRHRPGSCRTSRGWPNTLDELA